MTGLVACACGCGKTAAAVDRRGRPRRIFRCFGKSGPALERLWAKVDRSGECWLWIGAVTTHGYGEMAYRGRPVGAHRLVYILTVGSIPRGMFVCHKCDNRRCVRPAHLFLGTNLENQRDARLKGRLVRGTQPLVRGALNGSARLTEDQVVLIRTLYASTAHYSLRDPRRIRQEDLAARFGVSQVAIGKVVHHKLWKYSR